MKKYILCEKNYKKFNTREERGLQRCCSIEATVAITSQQTKQRRAPAKPMHTEKDTVDVRKSQGTRESGKATTFSQHLRERCGEGHSPAC